MKYESDGHAHCSRSPGNSFQIPEKETGESEDQKKNQDHRSQNTMKYLTHSWGRG